MPRRRAQIALGSADRDSYSGLKPSTARLRVATVQIQAHECRHCPLPCMTCASLAQRPTACPTCPRAASPPAGPWSARRGPSAADSDARRAARSRRHRRLDGGGHRAAGGAGPRLGRSAAGLAHQPGPGPRAAGTVAACTARTRAALRLAAVEHPWCGLPLHAGRELCRDLDQRRDEAADRLVPLPRPGLANLAARVRACGRSACRARPDRPGLARTAAVHRRVPRCASQRANVLGLGTRQRRARCRRLGAVAGRCDP